MTAAPKVSVCIPVYNGERFIGETLESVLAQTFSDFEVVVSDNCSTDDTLDIVRKLDDGRVRIVSNEANIGAIPNWNRVRAEARAPYVKFLSADDLVYPECLARQVEALDRHPSAVMAAARRDIVDEDGRIIVGDRGLGGLNGLVPGLDAIRRTVRSGTNLLGEPAFALVRREALERCPPFDDAFPYAVDLRLWTEILQHGDLFAIADTLGAFRVQLQSESVSIGGLQSRQVQGLFRELHERLPEVVSRTDVVTGSARAAMLARLRLVLYRRMRSRRKPVSP